MFNVTVHVTGLTQAQKRMIDLNATFRDFTEAMALLGERLIYFYGDTVFNSEGAALLGQRWTALKASTERSKVRLWRGRGILERSGDLRKGFKKDVTPTSLMIYNDVDYFPYHQLGTTAEVVAVPPNHPGRGNNLPARPMLGVNDLVVGIIQKTMDEDVRAKIEGSLI